MQLTNENYYSKEANEEYLSVSQYKDFMGTYGKRGCEEYALAKIEGTWEENMEDSDALMVGSYVDAHFEGTLDLFKAKHPCMFKKDGGLMAKYLKANEMIQRCERDEVFSHYMSGEKQVIMTADMFGAKWKQKAEIALLKARVQTDDSEEIADDGFLEALNGAAVEDWGDEEN